MIIGSSEGDSMDDCLRGLNGLTTLILMLIAGSLLVRFQCVHLLYECDIFA